MTDLSTAAVAAKERPTVEQWLGGQSEGIAAALGGRIGPDRFIRAAVTAFKTTPALQNCSGPSILGALFVAAQMGLEVGGPQALAHLVPYGKEAQLIVGYRGYVELFYRAGARKVEWFIVREGDTWRQWSSGRNGKDYEWVPLNDDSSRPMTGAVAQVRLASGDFQFEYMSRAQVEARRPKNSNKGPWADWFDEMALKTVMRQLAKTVRQSTDELAIAVNNDGAVITHVEGLPPQVERVPVEGDTEDDAVEPGFGSPLGRTEEEIAEEQK